MNEALTTAVTMLTEASFARLQESFWILLYFEIPRFVLGGMIAVWFVMANRRDEEARRYFERPGQRISVVVPGHNDGRLVEKTVVSIREQTWAEIEIIVVNDGSTDNTDSVCRRLERQGLIDIYIANEVRGGKASAVNAALQAATGELFVVTDADTTFDRDAFAIAASYFADPDVGAVAGNLRVRNIDDSLATRIQHINYTFSIQLNRIVRDMMGFFFVASGAFGVYRREAVLSLGGWDFGPGEDSDIATRLKLAGWRLRFAPLSTCRTHVPDTMVRLARQRLRWNRSMVRNRFRKARGPALNPFHRNFDIWLAISFFDIYFQNLIIPFAFLTYLGVLFGTYGEAAPIIFMMVLAAYLVLGFIRYLIALSVSVEPVSDARYLIYLPLYTVTNLFFLRMIRAYAVANELIFRGSYTDSYVPKKVRDQAQRY